MKVYETSMKLSGWTLKFRAIRNLIIGILLILAGIILAVAFNSLPSLILVLFGLIAILVSWLDWSRSKSLIQGKLYSES